MKLGFKYEQHEQLCMKKSKGDFCPVVNCQLDQASELCPEHCKDAQQGDIIIFETILPLRLPSLVHKLAFQIE